MKSGLGLHVFQFLHNEDCIHLKCGTVFAGQIIPDLLKGIIFFYSGSNRPIRIAVLQDMVYCRV